jgi:hypothetical protein
MTDNAIAYRQARRKYSVIDDLNPQGGGMHPEMGVERAFETLNAEQDPRFSSSDPRAQQTHRDMDLVFGVPAGYDDSGAARPSAREHGLAAFNEGRRGPESLSGDPLAEGRTSVQSHFMRAWREQPTQEMYDALDRLSRLMGVRPPWERVPRKLRPGS